MTKLLQQILVIAAALALVAVAAPAEAEPVEETVEDAAGPACAKINCDRLLMVGPPDPNGCRPYC